MLTFAEAALTGPFERTAAAGTRGTAYVVPEDPENNRVEWEIHVPRQGVFYLWLRYLHRGSGGRGGEVRQEVGVRLDGEPIATLGGGLTDLHVPDEHISPTCPLAAPFANAARRPWRCVPNGPRCIRSTPASSARAPAGWPTRSPPNDRHPLPNR